MPPRRELQIEPEPEIEWAGRLERVDERLGAATALGAPQPLDEGAGGEESLERYESEVVELCGATHKSTHVEHLVMWSFQPVPRR